MCSVQTMLNLTEDIQPLGSWIYPLQFQKRCPGWRYKLRSGVHSIWEVTGSVKISKTTQEVLYSREATGPHLEVGMAESREVIFLSFNLGFWLYFNVLISTFFGDASLDSVQLSQASLLHPKSQFHSGAIFLSSLHPPPHSLHSASSRCLQMTAQIWSSLSLKIFAKLFHFG